MKKVSIAAMVIIVALSTVSCSHKVTRVSPNESIDLSGRWNNTDSRLVSEELIQQILKERWLGEHQEAHGGQRPVVIVGFVTNKSHEHIEAETFVADVEQSFIRSGRVRLVQGGKKRDELRAEKADQQTNASVSSMKNYILQGSINSIVDSQKRRKVVYYQINLELTNIQTNEVVWVGDKKIAKYIKN
jgi:penicillin-binding protein activator